MRTVPTMLLVLLLCLTNFLDAKTIKVPQDFAKIQLAINAAVNGDTILVSEGSYKENLFINKKITLASLFLQDKDTSHISKTIIDGSQPSNPDSASVIHITTGSDSTTVIQGLTIRGGKGTRHYDNNTAKYWIAGGGIFVSAGGATIINNRIIQNTLTGKVGAPDVYGAGIAIYPALGALSPWLVKDNFIGYNTAEGHFLEGGGVWCTGTGKFLNNTVINNSATAVNTLGPNYYARGGGIGMGEMANIDIQSNYISKNSCTNEGGGLSCYAFAGSSTVVRFKNNIFTGNVAQTHAAAIQINSGDYTFVNNTIAGNSGPYALWVGASNGILSYKMMNNIIWNPLVTIEFNTATGVSASYNCVRGGLSGTGNINANPLFAASDTLYRLSSASPAMGGGVPSASLGGLIVNAPSVDYSGSSRPNPAWSKPDLGAIESAQAFPGALHTYRVPQDFAKIQNAINASVNGDLVLVSEGTYKENIVITKKITVASLYFQDKDTSHISKTIIDGSTPTHTDSMSVVTVDGATDTTTVVTGFTITGGKGNRRQFLPSFLYWRMGTGIDVAGGGVRISYNIIRANNNTNGNDSIGGSVSVWDPMDVNGVSFAIIENNVISDNILVGTMVESAGLAIGHNSIIRNNIISRNTNAASVLQKGTAGGMSIWNGTVLLTNNRITNNSAPNFGGGILIYGDPTVSWIPTVTMVNNIIMNNSAGRYGGGIIIQSSISTVSSINNTIAMNIAGIGGSGLCIDVNANINALNTILWNPVGTELKIFSGGSVNAQYCDIRGGIAGTGNIDSDPLFKSTNIDSLGMFFSGSPCKNAGVNSATVGGTVLTAPYRDYYGRVRPSTSTPDIGAFEDGTWTGVRDLISNHLPTSFDLSQNYPNPFNPSTTIRYALPSSAHVKLTIHDILAREIATLVNEEQSAGWKEVQWNARNVASGIYFYKITAGSFVETKKMLLVR